MANISKTQMTWKKVAEPKSIEKEKGIEVSVDGKRIAIFNKDGYYALDALCVHQDGSIAPGKLEGDIVECPLHFWHYNIKTGKLLDYLKDVNLQTYKCEERSDGIYIDI